MKTPKIPGALVLSAIAFAILTLPAYAQVSTFNGATSNDYGDPTNWTPSGEPNLSTGATALINNGSAVTYNAGTSNQEAPGTNDFIISNGGTLEISNGSWTQTGGNNWIQIGEQGEGAASGDGNILVNGGTFNQGTDSNSPFQVSGLGNTFTISSGAANFNNGVNVVTGITYSVSGGSVTATGGGLNVQANSYTQTGGTTSYAGPLQVTGGVYSQTSGSASYSQYLSVSSGTYMQSGGSGTFVNDLSVGGGSYLLTGGTNAFNSQGAVNSGLLSVGGGTLTLAGDLIVGSSGTFVQSSGTINVGVEFDINNAHASMSGGVMNITNLFTMTNSAGAGLFNFSGGVINDENAINNQGGFYAASAATPFNFTVASTGTLNFTNDSLSTVQGWVSAGDIAYNDTTDPSAFSYSTNGNVVSVFLTVPEPSTYALIGLGSLGMFFILRRKKAGLSA